MVYTQKNLRLQCQKRDIEVFDLALWWNHLNMVFFFSQFHDLISIESLKRVTTFMLTRTVKSLLGCQRTQLFTLDAISRDLPGNL